MQSLAFRKNIFKYTNVPLLLLCVAVSLYGLITVFIAFQADDMEKLRTVKGTLGGYIITSQFITQALVMLFGLILVVVMSFIDIKLYEKYWWVIATIGIILVLLTYVVGLGVGSGADDKAWLMIPVIHKTFQPSELLKIAFVISFSVHLSKVMDSINKLSTLALLCLHGAVPVVMVMLQGDDGTALVFAFMFLAMLFGAGLRIRYIVAAVLPVILASVLFWQLIDDEKKMRFRVIFDQNLDPRGIGYQQLQAKMVIGNGGITGVGPFNGGQIYLPERHNDFIFSVICESFGFLGAVVALILVVLLLTRILKIGKQCPYFFGKILCIGVFSTIASQTIINIGMNVGLLPVIGVTLPFFSAGGSSIITLYMGIGLVMGVHKVNVQENVNGRAFVSSKIV